MNNGEGGAPQHGGNPHALPVDCDPDALLDLATGINPWSWPLQDVSLACLKKLPYHSPALSRSAAAYYGLMPQQLLATAGSQPAIELLPRQRAPGRVLMPAPAYEEHCYRWQQAGHQVFHFPHHQGERVAELIARHAIDHLVLISPNNPTGTVYSDEQILGWRQLLPPRGLLVVDQAFADAGPASDCARLVAQGVVVLRSVGKFFGLPGLRLGFVLAPPALLAALEAAQGPWTVNSLAQSAGADMLLDRQWQAASRHRLGDAAQRQSAWLVDALAGSIDTVHRAALFTTLEMPLQRGLDLQQLAYRCGLSVRVYQWQQRAYMRWGLAADEARLQAGLAELKRQLAATRGQGCGVLV